MDECRMLLVDLVFSVVRLLFISKASLFFNRIKFVSCPDVFQDSKAVVAATSCLNGDDRCERGALLFQGLYLQFSVQVVKLTTFNYALKRLLNRVNSKAAIRI